MKSLSVGALLSALLCLEGCRSGEVTTELAATAEHGRYLVSTMDCGGCHNSGAHSANPEQGFLQGSGIGLGTPNGIYYPPNLTPDAATGIGKWSEADIVKALKTGERPDGRILEAMPWRQAYSKLTYADARSIAKYLKSMGPVAHQVPGPAVPATAVAPYTTVTQPAVLGR